MLPLLCATHGDHCIKGKLSSPHCPLQGPHEPHVTAAPPPPLCVRAKLQPTMLSAPATNMSKDIDKTMRYTLLTVIAVLTVVVMVVTSERATQASLFVLQATTTGQNLTQKLLNLAKVTANIAYKTLTLTNKVNNEDYIEANGVTRVS